MLRERGMKINGLINVLPQEFVLNQDLQFSTPQEKEQFIENVGINKRYVAPSNNNIVSYLEKGIEVLLDRLGWEYNEVDFLCIVSQSGLGVLPSMAHQLHGSFEGKSEALVWDLNLGCSAWGYALFQAHKVLQGLGDNAKAILCLGDLSSQLIAPDDNSTKFIFSDAINILGLELDEKEPPFYYSFLNPGKGVKSIYRGLDERSSKGMVLDGLEVFQHAVSLVPAEINKMIKHLEQEQVTISTLVLHQANQLINHAIINQIDVERYQVLETLNHFGNAGIASIGLTLGVEANRALIPEYICACGFGVGFSISTMAFKFSPRVNELIKI